MLREQKHITAFVDESGTHDLEVGKAGVSPLFVCGAVMVETSDLERANVIAKELQKKFFSGEELKSSNVGNNHKRRLKLLKAMGAIPFGYYANIIDKSQIFKDSGLRFKPSFYKAINRMLYERLSHGISFLHIIADEIGSKKFMDSFKSYLEKKSLPSLYINWGHDFSDSVDTPLIQVADIVVGTLAWCFDPKRDCGEYRDQFLDILQLKELGVEKWPSRVELLPQTLPTTSSEWDIRIRTICRNAVVKFIERFSGDPSQERQMQVALLRHMLFLNEHEVADDRAKHRESLVQHLKWQGFEDINDRKFRQSVIGPLRDAGIIIAGDSNGYRLAMSVDDVNRYIRHDRSIIEPMLARLLKGRNLLKTGTVNQFDMLTPDEFSVIREVVQTFSRACLTYNIAEASEDVEDQEDIP